MIIAAIIAIILLVAIVDAVLVSSKYPEKNRPYTRGGYNF